jgi:ABC-type nitrate/sulfonate/bicarbonate transport system substrate-binding protein
MRMTRTWKGLLALGVLGVVMGGGTAGAQERAKIRLIVLPGSQWYAVEAMTRGGFVEKHKLEIERKNVASVPAIYTALRANAGDIAFAGWVSNLQYRAQGLDFLNIFPLTEFHNDILVRTDSSIKQMSELKGKRVGIYGGPAGTTTAMFKVQVGKFFGIDADRDIKLHFGASPLLGGLLEKGEVDAIMVTDPVTTKLLQSGKFRSIGNLNDIHRERTGEGLLMLTITTRDEFARKHPETVKAFLRAYVDAMGYLRGNAALWQELARASGVESKEGAEMLRSRLEKNYLTGWDDTYIAKQLGFAREIQNLLGKKYLPEIPADGLTLTYSP